MEEKREYLPPPRATGQSGFFAAPITLWIFWGDRYGKFTDPFRHQWAVATHVEDVSPEEMKRRSDEMTKRMAKAAGQGN